MSDKLRCFFFVFKWFQSTRIPVLQWNNRMVTMVTWTPKSRHLIVMSFSRILKVMDLHGTRGIQIQSNGILEHSSTSSLHTRLGIVGSCISLKHREPRKLLDFVILVTIFQL